ncbi:plexin-A4-like isoform X2 [Clytia hemisphaerica]|uniref:Sema domain-containing protein n=1 Tax=Clytia hemisphaerica TaxID=252671 RepID=A0A7M6DNX4_9CNID
MGCLINFVLVISHIVIIVDGEMKTLDFKATTLLIHKDNIYVGGINKLARFDSGLNRLFETSNGPVLNNKYCHPVSLEKLECMMGEKSLEPEDNINKILLYTEKPTPMIIACGSIYQGICQFLNVDTLQNITEIYKNKAYTNQIVASTSYISSNGPDASATAFINYSKSSTFIVNAKTMTIRPLRQEHLVISAVKLGNQLSEDQFLTSPDAEINYKAVYFFKKSGLAMYKVYYKSSFQIGDNVYFTTTQKNLQSSDPPNVSKIIQIKFQDNKLNDYVEMPFLCQKGGVNFNVLVSSTLKQLNSSNVFSNTSPGDYILIGIFKTEIGPKKYAVCSYVIKNLIEKANNVRKSCKDQKLVPWSEFKKQSACSDQLLSAVTEEFDGKLLYESIEEIGVVDGHEHDRGFSLYLSFPSHSIKMFHLSTKDFFQYAKEKQTGDGLFKKIEITNDHLFAISDNSIAKVPLKRCESRKTCKDCLAGPSCGWCVLEGGCTEERNCANSKKKNYFISSSFDACPNMDDIEPNVAARQDSKQVSFDVINIPTDISYQCAYNGDYKVNAKLENSKIQCSAVDFNKVPGFIASIKGDDEVDLSLIYSNKVIATSTITLYDCTSLKMCQTCTTGSYKCNWCTDSMTCSSSCQGPFVEGNSSDTADQCPQIKEVDSSYLPSDVSRSIKLVGNMLPAVKSRSSYQCHLNIEGSVQSVSAKLSNPKELICDQKAFTFSGENSTTAKLDVTYGTNQIFTNELEVLMYKCDYKRKDCSSCLASPTVLQCGWCSGTSLCGVKEQCLNRLTTICPNPIITKVTPPEISSGGNTKVIIEGTDLGVTTDDVLSVTLAGLPCTKTQDSKRNYIVCLSSYSGGPREGSVDILVRKPSGNQTGTFPNFYYREPKVTSFSPKIGTCSGGTTLRFKGNYLDVANQVEVTVGASPCKNLNATRELITCQTSARINCQTDKRRRRRKRNVGDDGIKVTMDQWDVPGLQGQTFKYEKNPSVFRLYTNKRNIHPKFITGGGQVFIVEGARFNIIQNVKIIFSTKSPLKLATFEVVCEINQEEKVICLTPNVTEVAISNKRSSFDISTDIQLDGYSQDFDEIQVLPDPLFHKFEDGVRIVKTDDLILTGEYLETIASEDVKVNIAGIPCKVTDLDRRLVCTIPPESEVLAASPYINKAPIQVLVGKGGLTYDLGFVQFFSPEDNEEQIKLIIGLTVGALFLILLIIVIACVYMRIRRKKRDRENDEQVRLRMDRMESQYARECKEAFAEYQTEITDLTHDVDQMKSPYLDFPQYAMRVLYPGVFEHDILKANINSKPEWEGSMRSLIVLLKNKDFLLNFVRTLEGQSAFQMNDRCAVASLLMVSLQDDLRYVTEILTELLKDLIKKPGKKRPKLLLRRTESVAEKLLTNWLAYTLHSFLENHVGEPLFNLFTAINILLEKEPVDAITSDARNSLSEDKLLRQKIDFKSISINVEYIHDGGEESFNGIPVLTCDTITQTKEKIIKFIYKDKPYSSWPCLEELELGFASASGAITIFKDEDSTSKVEGEYKKINSLQHYNVQDQTNLRLASGSAIQHNISLNESASALSNNTSMPSVNFSTSTPLLHHIEGNEPKLFHIVKTSDYPQEQKEDMRHSKMMAEVYLTRLLKTKETLQLFVNKLFDSIFGLHEGGRTIPPSVKYLFDFLDAQAMTLDINEDEVRHTWKNNSLPLRFWINIIKNPNFVFDIKKSNTVDSCLSVIAQLFMDSCSPDEHRLGKDSPSNKLLYAKEIPEYKKKVTKFYEDVASQDFENEDFFQILDGISKNHGAYFNSCNAARALMEYAEAYKVQLMENLERNNHSELYDRLQDIMSEMPDD